MGAVLNLRPTNIAMRGLATTGLRPRGSARSLLASAVRAKKFPASGTGLPQFVSLVDVRTERRYSFPATDKGDPISDDWEAMRRAVTLRGLVAAEALSKGMRQINGVYTRFSTADITRWAFCSQRACIPVESKSLKSSLLLTLFR